MISLAPLLTLRNVEFRHLLIGRFFLVIAFRMMATLLGWWVYQLTHDPFSIGLIGLSEVIPAVSCALFAGHIIDMNEKKKLLLLTNYAYVFFLSLLLIPAFLSHKLDFTNHQITYFIYGVIFFSGICRAFLAPLVPSMIPTIVSRKTLPNAITLNQATFLTASVSGHALGGFLIAWIGIPWTLVVILSSLMTGSLFFWTLNRHYSDYKGEEKPNVWKSMHEGISYIYKTKEVFGAILLDMFAVLFGGAVAMIPVFATDILKVGSEGFGILNAASDIGSMCIIITLSFIQLKRNQGKILLAVVVGFGLCIIGFGLSRLYWLSFGLLMLSGMLDGISVVIRGTIVQLKTPDHIRGRVLSVNTIFVTSSNELGQFESGVAAKFLGVVRSVIFGGCMTILIAGLVGTFAPKLRKMEY
ncbi:MFS transporter [Elizabethkingia sp. JS20170427COW]|uniref:MFS transporter n=1 Tax=Elizabethkingia sp. JS20170427COW TaxID=2583851 RepID=UPI001110EB9A|nr:MFS transporter [Elizabethkingia sp. JS20170427COW]QCX53414.1 MFS transporter [Elizabethkingia sp. JS20170427COW]